MNDSKTETLEYELSTTQELERDIILIANRINWLNDERIFFRDQGKLDISERFKKQALEAKEKLTFLVNLLDTLKNDSI